MQARIRSPCISFCKNLAGKYKYQAQDLRIWLQCFVKFARNVHCSKQVCHFAQHYT